MISHMNEPFTFDRFLALPRLSSLKLSPDGTRLIVAVSRPGPEGKEMKTALWQVDPAGGRRRSADHAFGCRRIDRLLPARRIAALHFDSAGPRRQS
jgi:dipeptidyl aminopeptidase/acylaminoacyl peptidase